MSRKMNKKINHKKHFKATEFKKWALSSKGTKLEVTKGVVIEVLSAF